MKFKIDNNVLTGVELTANDDIDNLIIPDGIEAIAPNVFSKEVIGKNIRLVSFPETLKRIGKSAFSGQNQLTSIKFPRSLTSIAANAFREIGECDILIIPKHNASNPAENRLTIDSQAFIGSQINSIEIYGEDIDIELGNTVFSECVNLSEVKIYARNLFLSEYCFALCHNLKNISISGKCELIPYKCFYKCESLSAFNFNNIQRIEESAFGFSGLQQISFSKSIKTIERQAFNCCYSLESVEFCEGACNVIIKHAAFLSCENLLSFDFSPVTLIEASAFAGTEKLKDVTLGAAILQDYAFKRSGVEHANISKITRMGNGVFKECSNLKHIDLPSIEKISNEVFSHCKNLKEITIPEGVQCIGANAFDFTGLECVFFPSSLSCIEDSAFKDSNLSSVDFSHCNSLSKIEKLAFMNTNIAEADLRNCILSDGYDFSAFNVFTSVYLPYYLGKIPYYA